MFHFGAFAAYNDEQLYPVLWCFSRMWSHVYMQTRLFMLYTAHLSFLSHAMILVCLVFAAMIIESI